jgi:hypothetical protein
MKIWQLEITSFTGTQSHTYIHSFIYALTLSTRWAPSMNCQPCIHLTCPQIWKKHLCWLHVGSSSSWLHSHAGGVIGLVAILTSLRCWATFAGLSRSYRHSVSFIKILKSKMYLWITLDWGSRYVTLLVSLDLIEVQINFKWFYFKCI